MKPTVNLNEMSLGYYNNILRDMFVIILFVRVGSTYVFNVSEIIVPIDPDSRKTGCHNINLHIMSI